MKHVSYFFALFLVSSTFWSCSIESDSDYTDDSNTSDSEYTSQSGQNTGSTSSTNSTSNSVSNTSNNITLLDFISFSNDDDRCTYSEFEKCQQSKSKIICNYEIQTSASNYQDGYINISLYQGFVEDNIVIDNLKVLGGSTLRYHRTCGITLSAKAKYPINSDGTQIISVIDGIELEANDSELCGTTCYSTPSLYTLNLKKKN
jgi:hypothetical protein